MNTVEYPTRFLTSAFPLIAAARHSSAPPQTLIQAVQAAVERVPESLLLPIPQSFSSIAFQPKVMLALLTYWYARQTYASADIERFLANDGPFCQACGNQVPDAAALQQFRTLNQDMLKACLTQVLSFLANQKVEAGRVTKVNHEHVSEEAKRRLIMAACLDLGGMNSCASSFSAWS